MNDEEINKRFEEIEKRLGALENKKSEKIAREDKEENFSGISGGINLLIKNGFLNSLRDANEIKEELKREGYHHSIGSISKMLSVNFTKNKKVLTRIKEKDIYKYVLRK